MTSQDPKKTLKTLNVVETVTPLWTPGTKSYYKNLRITRLLMFPLTNVILS